MGREVIPEQLSAILHLREKTFILGVQKANRLVGLGS
jgi:hypothetical protein